VGDATRRTLAYITKQLPTRVAIHASEMIPSPISLPKTLMGAR